MLLKNLMKIANKLDEVGRFEEADSIDNFSKLLSDSLDKNDHNVPVIEGVITEVYDKDSDKHISNGHKHGESYMTLPLLKKIRDLSNSMCSMIDEGEKVEDWIESYVSQMAKMMDDVHTAWKYRYDK